MVFGAVEVGEATGVEDTEAAADGIDREAAAWPPHAVNARRAAPANAALFAGRPYASKRRFPTSAPEEALLRETSNAVGLNRIFICTPTNYNFG